MTDAAQRALDGVHRVKLHFPVNYGSAACSCGEFTASGTYEDLVKWSNLHLETSHPEEWEQFREVREAQVVR